MPRHGARPSAGSTTAAAPADGELASRSRPAAAVRAHAHGAGPRRRAATVLILGTHGVATVAAAGVLLTATGTIGALCFATWALTDWLWAHERRPRLAFAGRSSPRSTASAVRIALGALSAHERRTVEVAYFGGLDQLDMARMLYLPLRRAPKRPRLWPAPAWSS